MMDAAVVKRAERKVRRAMGTVAQRVKTLRGVRKMERKVRQAPVRKQANIQWEAKRTSWSAVMMLAGRATAKDQPENLEGKAIRSGALLVAPASSSERMISTGLNQYNVAGVEHPRYLTPVPLAVIPQPHLVEIMQPQCPGDRIDQLGLRHRLGDDV